MHLVEKTKKINNSISHEDIYSIAKFLIEKYNNKEIPVVSIMTDTIEYLIDFGYIK